MLERGEGDGVVVARLAATIVIVFLVGAGGLAWWLHAGWVTRREAAALPPTSARAMSALMALRFIIEDSSLVLVSTRARPTFAGRSHTLSLVYAKTTTRKHALNTLAWARGCGRSVATTPDDDHLL